ncbi:metalloregulator ArsR/SmtB family transcription factor [Micromonospora sp. B11E3]|uniref:ArsR/SmtB family transcription factor n=1 Tax=Micromonospora sp. B11E3 TaxID=3153562 RepID=UPI00325F91E0
MNEFVELGIYTQLARIGKALAHPVRLRLLDLLEDGEIEVDRLARAADVSLKNTSAQLQQLRSANLVVTRRQGNRIYYRLAGPEVSSLLSALQSCAEQRLADLREAIADLLGDPDEMMPVTVDQLRTRLDDPGVVVVDVRPAREYARGHIPGAVNLPAQELEARFDDIPRNVEIIAYCQGPYCVLSPDVVRLLRDRGYPARPLAGGMTRWAREGGTVQRGGQMGADR